MPADLFDKYNIEVDERRKPQEKSEPNTLLHSIATSIPVETILGMGDAPSELLMNLGNILGTKTKFQPSGEGTAYQVGKGIGDIGSFLAGGEILGGAEAAQAIPALARRAIGSAAFGAAQDPQDPGAGAGRSAALSLMFDALPLGGRVVKNIYKGVAPTQHAAKIADAIANSFKDVKNKFSDLYDPILGKYGNKVSKELNAIKELPEKDLDRFYPGSTNAYEDFIKNPNIKNAHTLQSQLGFEERRLATKNAAGTLQPDENTSWKAIKRSRAKVKNALHNALNESEPNLAHEYQDVTKKYLEEATPYKSTPYLAKISAGKIKKPKVGTLLNKLEEAEFEPFNYHIRNLNKRLLGQKLAKMLGGLSAAEATGEGAALPAALAGYQLPNLFELMEGSVAPNKIDALQNILTKGIGGARTIAVPLAGQGDEE